MSRPDVIKARSRGLTRPTGRALLFAGAAVLPVALMGVTLPSAVAVREAKVAQLDCKSRLCERNELAKKLSGYGSEGAIDEVEALERVLRNLVPTDLNALEVFGRLRAVAAPHGTDLTTIEFIRTHRAGSSSIESGEEREDTALVVDEVLIGLTSSIGNSFALVDDLRASGLPTLVLGFEFSRENVLASTYQTELRLGFLRRVQIIVDAADTDTNQ